MTTSFPSDFPADPTRATRVRWLVLFLLTMATANAYITRGMGAMTTTIREELGYTDAEMGGVMAGFAIGYIWMQVPGGWLGTLLGARLVLPLMTVGVSICTLWLGLATTGAEIYWARFGIGIFQGGLVPCCAKVLADWFPGGERGVASSLVAGGMQIGGVLSMGLTGLLLTQLEWRSIFQLYSVIGIVWSVAFVWLFRNLPAEHPRINDAERELISAGIAPPVASPKTVSGSLLQSLMSRLAETLGLMLMSVCMWTMCLQAYCRAYGYEFFPTWFPAYLNDARGVSLLQSTTLTMVPMVAVALGGFTGGMIVDWVYRRTGSKWLSRSGVSAAALTACALTTLGAAFAEDATTAVLIVSLGAYFAGFGGPTTWAAIIDISGKRTAVITGVMNLCGNIGSVACTKWTGDLFTYIKGQEEQDRDWNLVLYSFVGIYLLGAVFWLFLNPAHTLDGTRRKATTPEP